MPKPRTATAILEARGAFAKNPNRTRVEPKVADPFPDVAPGGLSDGEVRAWHYIRKQVPGGVLTSADQSTVILAATLWAEFWSDRTGFSAAKIGHLRAVLGTLGMSPSDRAKLATKPDGDDGDF